MIPKKYKKGLKFLVETGLPVMDVLALSDILVLSLFCLLCIFGNLTVITSVIKFDYLQTKTNMFVVALAVCDFIMGTIALPSTPPPW